MMKSKKKSKILVVDDSPEALDLLTEFLSMYDYEIVTADHPDRCIEHISKTKFNLILLDIILPKMSGVELLKIIKRKDPIVPVIIISGVSDVETAMLTAKMGIFDYMTKPIDLQRLELMIENALSMQKLKKEVTSLKDYKEKKEISIFVKSIFMLLMLVGIIFSIGFFIEEKKVTSTKTNDSTVIISELDQIEQLGFDKHDVKIFCKLIGISYSDFINSPTIQRQYELFKSGGNVLNRENF